MCFSLVKETTTWFQYEGVYTCAILKVNNLLDFILKNKIQKILLDII